MAKTERRGKEKKRTKTIGRKNTESRKRKVQTSRQTRRESKLSLALNRGGLQERTNSPPGSKSNTLFTRTRGWSVPAYD